MSPDVVIVGPASWNTIVQLPQLPEPRPHTVSAEDSWSTLGGTSAGKALQLADLGIATTLDTVVGTDPEAELILAALDHGPITLVAERSEGGSERHLNLMAGSDRLSIYLSRVTLPDGPLPETTLAAIAEAHHVVLDLSLRARDAIPAASASTATVWTDLHDYDGRATYHQPILDAADAVFLSNDAIGDPRPLMTRILGTGKRLVVCTLGAEGALALDSEGWHQVDAVPTDVVDTNGAGDAFFAGFLAETITGGSVGSALRRGAAQAQTALGSRHLSPLLDHVPLEVSDD